MSLPNYLISQFAKATNDTKKRTKETVIAYGTTVRYNNATFVKLDGSEILTPVTSTADTIPGERVMVTIKNHAATITGNITSPAARTGDVNQLNKDVNGAEKVATNFLNLTDDLGLIVGDRTGDRLAGNIQLKAEVGGASISLRDGTTILTKFSATSKAFTGVTSTSDSSGSSTITTEDEDGTESSETMDDVEQTVYTSQTKPVVKFESPNPIYFSNGITTNKILISDDSFISNVNLTLNGRIFDANGKAVLEPITSNGNLSIGYGRYKAATASSTDFSTLYGNKVRLYTKNGAQIIQDGRIAFETLNSKGNMALGYHLKKKGSGNLNLYGGDAVNIYAKSASIADSTGSSCFQAKNEAGNTTLGYARYANGGETNVYGGTALNLQAASGGTIVAKSAIVPETNASLSLGKYNELGWSNIYIGNAGNTYSGLRMIQSGKSLNMCGRDANGRFIFGNTESIMYYVNKSVDTTTTGTAFKFTSGNNDAENNTSSVWLFGGADTTSRYIGSYVAYNRTYTNTANMCVTSNGVFGRSTSSSQRYKRDIVVANIDDFKGLYELPVKKFKYKNDYIAADDELYDKYLYGFIVEDLERFLPCAVQHEIDENGTAIPEMWNSNIIVPSLLKLIQDLNTRLKSIEEGA
jgi:hypothetical protein